MLFKSGTKEANKFKMYLNNTFQRRTVKQGGIFITKVDSQDRTYCVKKKKYTKYIHEELSNVEQPDKIT